MIRRQHRPTLFPYTTLFRSRGRLGRGHRSLEQVSGAAPGGRCLRLVLPGNGRVAARPKGRSSPVVRQGSRVARAERQRSEEHTSELQSHVNLVCRLLLEKKK